MGLWDISPWLESRFIPFDECIAGLLADLPAEIRRIADFLEIPVGAETLQTVCEVVTLDSMRKADKVGTTARNGFGAMAQIHSFSKGSMAVGRTCYPPRNWRFEEWLAVITGLLRSSGPFTFEGRFFQMREATVMPRPQRPP